MNKRVTFILEFRIRRNIFTLNWGKTRWRKYHFQLVNASLKSLHKSFTLFDFRGAVYADMGHFERCITLWMYALDMQQKILEPLSPMTQSSLLSFAELFSFMMSEGGRIFLYFFCLHNCKDFNDYVVISSISLMETFEFKTLAQFVNEKFGLF